MQSLFRLPWSTDTGGDKLAMDRKQPIVEIPLLNKQKRKRVDSTESSPNTSHQQKKFKAATSGAVQPTLLPARGPEAYLPIPTAETQLQLDNLQKSTGADGSNEVATPAIIAPDTPVNQAAAPTSNEVSGSSEVGSTHVPNAPDAPAAMGTTAQPTPHITRQQSTSEAIFEQVDMTDADNVDRLRSVIDAQLNLEILLKHSELRLIEQELAKCQVALEQLRRCELIPYPGLQEPSANVAGGVGPALDVPAGFTAPKLPAPWGVTDGPYSRHYADWLIKDPLFDPAVAQPTPVEWSGSAYFSRASRKSADVVFSPLPAMRAARSSASTKGQLPPHDPSRPYRDPLVIKRQQDGKWVKLYCTKCKPERSDFNNVQGFLNHCRISHKDNHVSHEAAAIACGRPVEVSDAFMMEPPPPPRHRSSLATVEPSGSRTPTVATPIATSSTQILPGSVHGLNKTQATRRDSATLRQNVVPRKFNPLAQSQSIPEGSTAVHSPLVPSPLTPHLSQLLQQRGMSGNLDETVIAAKRKADLSIYDCSDSESHPEEPANKRSKAAAPKKSGGMTIATAAARRAPAAAPSANARPVQLPIVRPNGAARLPAPLSSLASSSHVSGVRSEGMSSRFTEGEVLGSPLSQDLEVPDLSPGSTAIPESNPGLVSDREDDEDYVDEEETRSVMEGPKRGSFQSDAMVVIEDGSDAERGITRKRLGTRQADAVVVEGICARTDSDLGQASAARMG